MKLLIAIIVLFMFAQGSDAKVSKTLRGDGSGASCTGCLDARDSTVDQLRQLRSTVGGDTSYAAIYGYNLNRSQELARACSKFATEDGPGPWARSIKSFMTREEFPYLLDGTDDLHRICPAYTSLRDSEKEVVWVAVLNVMTIGESTCGTDPMMNRKRGPNGRLYGEMQLHSGREHTYSPGCKKGDSKTAASSFRCTLHMLDDQLRREGKLFSRKSYWDVLRPQARSQKYKAIKTIIAGLPICK